MTSEIPDWRVTLPELTPEVVAAITRWQQTHGREWHEPPVLVPPRENPRSASVELLAKYAAWDEKPAGPDPITDMARWADDLAKAFGQVPTADDIVESMRSWAASMHPARLDHSCRLVREAGGRPPLQGEARAAYWRALLDPNR
jgi:hypothetical protein